MKNIPMTKVQILGMGCSKCRSMESTTKDIINTHNLKDNVSLEIVEDIDTFFKYRIQKTPALIIDGRVLPNQHELTYKKLERELLNAIKRVF